MSPVENENGSGQCHTGSLIPGNVCTLATTKPALSGFAFICVGVLLACLSVHRVYSHGVQKRLSYPLKRVLLNPGPLKEWLVLLTAELNCFSSPNCCSFVLS